MPVEPLPAEKLYRHANLDFLKIETTTDISEPAGILGQERAVDALTFGTGIERQGYNTFVLGVPGSGRHSLVERLLKETAASRPTPNDWAYVNNFERPHQPRAISLPPGRGAELARAMAAAIEELKASLPAVFESDEYQSRRQVIEESFKQQQEHAFEEVRKQAEDKGLALIQTPMGMALAPVRDGQVLKPAEFNNLPEEERQRIQHDIENLQRALQSVVEQLPGWDKERRRALGELNQEMANYAISHALMDVRQAFSDIAAVGVYLEQVKVDLLENIQLFAGQGESGPPAGLPMPVPVQQAALAATEAAFRSYSVNVLVDNGGGEGAPVIFDDNPALPFLVGRIEHISQMGALITDFTLIKPGALHAANGGYLLLDARKLLVQPFSWETLKRLLRSKEIRIESPGQLYGVMSTISLEPQPIPLSVKVVLIGERDIYYLLCQLDPDFPELFKVVADFEDVIDWGEEELAGYARSVAGIVQSEGLRAFDKDALARVIEHGARIADDAEKISLRFGRVADVMREADYWAGVAGREVAAAEDVDRAIEAQIHRLDRIRERSHEAITREIMLIDTDGEKVAQINGLSVLSLGNFSFGRPTRITARIRMGGGKVTDIEREVELGGPLHSKGVLILTGFLGANFSQDKPLALSASLVFEQSYGGVDGDSASSTELYALLSALAEVPIKQSLAVTGSVNQHGEVQAIGGVNEKIEGFFDICKARGLTGTQGVLIPVANVKHLMLRADVVEAARRGEFQIYPVRHVDEGIELLTGIPAGRRDGDGRFPEGTVYRRVEDRLSALAEARRAYVASGRDDDRAP